ncbi:SlyX family protein [Spirochaeta cellobiosiphila]|uniref:SlyX family protein n=1 Tax=Spirochaeta cellobiosiphila TaxID=504483 RepID=UPI00040152D0|nr:SlyX family protein [Spirochaeta cellobiosiphila]
MLEDRVDKLEVTLSYQEQVIEELSKQIYEQQKLLSQQALMIEKMKKKLKDLEDLADDSKPADQRPPHY